jgi:hypothetical protein
MMTEADSRVQNFIQNQTDIMPSLQFQGSPSREPSEIVQYCLQQLTRPSFRRSHLGEEAKEDLRTKLDNQIKRQLPITFAIPFGGYKNYRAQSYPDLDWAEVFNVNYLSRYVLPVTAYYAPGVILQYTYSAGIMDLVSNIPTSTSERYMIQFHKLLDLFLTVLPENLRFRAIDISAQYSGDDFLSELKENYEFNCFHWNEKLPRTEREKRIASAQRNLMRKGAEDLSGLNDAEWAERCVESAMWCEALDSMALRRKFNKYSDNIQLVFVRGPSVSVHVGSCETSAHHFWSGCGVLEEWPGGFRQRIISGEKLIEYRIQERIVDIKVDSVFGRLSDAFGQISVLKQPQEGR